VLQPLFSRGDGQLAHLLEAVVNHVLDAQMAEQLQAARYERSDERQGYRNGYKPRQLTTRVGRLTLRVPQARDGSFSTELVARYQRSEQALILTLLEMVVNGVSTRKVATITEELCGREFAKSTVSDLCKALDPLVEAWNGRDLGGTCYPFGVVDALVIKVRESGRVRARSALVATGVNADGYREILGLQLGDSESERGWTDFFAWLKGRGLAGVDLVVSDHHGGVVNAIRVQFQGATWQRCQMPLSANILDATPKALHDGVHARVRAIFEAPMRSPPGSCSPASSPSTTRQRPQLWRRWSAASTMPPPCWRCRRPLASGCARPMGWSASTKKFAAASASSASSPTGNPPGACSQPSLWSKMNSGARASATST
jgi:putative transposase